MASFNLLLLPGDGIGPEVMGEVSKLLAFLTKQGVANARVHATTGEVPNVRLQLERTKLQPLPVTVHSSPPIAVARRAAVPVPYESLQHPLAVYDSLLEVA